MDRKILILIIAVILLGGCTQKLKQTTTATTASTTTTSTTTTSTPASLIPPEVKEEARQRLSRVKFASLYERVSDGVLYGRSDEEVIDLLKETKTELIFRGFWRWMPVPESPDDIPPELFEFTGLEPGEVSWEVERNGYSYEQLKKSIASIKKEMQDVIFVGAVPAQMIQTIELNEVTGEVLGEDKTLELAVKPEKWGLKISGLLKLILGDRIEHYPDITNPEFQELLLSWARGQIDSGADAIWIDLLYAQANAFKTITNNPNHPAVKESYEAAGKIIDEIHEYGYSKNRYIYVGTWVPPDLPYPPPDLDFVTLTPSVREINRRGIDEQKWVRDIDKIRKMLGDIPILVFIDWANNDAPLTSYSQKLNKEDQREMLAKLDKFCNEKGMVFIYPIHGGNMGDKARILSYGNYTVYDSLAPEFNTYETIKELALNKTGKR